MGAKLLSANYSADFSDVINYLLPLIRQSWLPHRLFLATDSYGLYGRVTPLQELKIYILRPIVAAIRDAYDCREI